MALSQQGNLITVPFILKPQHIISQQLRGVKQLAKKFVKYMAITVKCIAIEHVANICKQ